MRLNGADLMSTAKASNQFTFDAASALSQGGRDYQEDALISDYSLGSDISFTVLADGMGGHAAGDMASKIVVTEVFSELMFQRADAEAFAHDIPQSLTAAALSANACLKAVTFRARGFQKCF